MSDPSPKIFRAEAYEHHMRGRHEPVLPRYLSPPVFLTVWILAGLFLLAGATAWYVRFPVLARGVAMVFRQEPGGDAALLLVLPADRHAELEVGRDAVLLTEGTGMRARYPIISVVPEVIGPAEAIRRFALRDAAAAAISRPSAVAVARFDTASDREELGSVYEVDVELGERRVLSMLPWIGPLFR